MCVCHDGDGEKRISLLLKADKRRYYDRLYLPKPRSVIFPARRISSTKCPRQNTIITRICPLEYT